MRKLTPVQYRIASHMLEHPLWDWPALRTRSVRAIERKTDGAVAAFAHRFGCVSRVDDREGLRRCLTLSGMSRGGR